MDMTLQSIWNCVNDELRSCWKDGASQSIEPVTQAFKIGLYRAVPKVIEQLGIPANEVTSWYHKAGTAVPRAAQEYMFDFACGRYPPMFHPHKCAPSMRASYGLIIAAESEQGTYTEVLGDCCKLLDARARIKCFLFRGNEQSIESTTHHLGHLFSRHTEFNEAERWLIWAIPWQTAQRPLFDPRPLLPKKQQHEVTLVPPTWWSDPQERQTP